MTSQEPEILRASIDAELTGERLDKALAKIWPDLSRARIQALMGEGKLSVNGNVETAAKRKVREDDMVALEIPAPVPDTPEPEDIALNILFEDAHLIVINKPAGLTVHPAAGNWSGTLVNALLHHCAGSLSGIGGVERPGIVHRLDKDTSGVMVVAKSDKAHKGLAKQFADHSCEREYRAITKGAPLPREGRIETRIARSPHDRKKQAVVRDPKSQAGRHAITNYRCIATFGQISGQPVGTPAAALIACQLETGRTHQIRVHLAHVGTPVMDDTVYGRPRAQGRVKNAAGEPAPNIGRQALHAASLGFVHPVSGEYLRFESPLPDDMAGLLAFLENL